MGWNKGYAIFESTVVGAYNLGKLDKELLTVLMEPYRDSDIDSGGGKDLQASDGKRIEQIVIETWGLPMPMRPVVDQAQDPDAWDDYDDAVYAQMRVVTGHFGWC